MTTNCIHPNKNWKNISISGLGLSIRIFNCLFCMGVTTLGELANLSDAELLKQPNFGKKSLNEVKKLLASFEDLSPNKQEYSGEADVLDFLEIKESLHSTLLREVKTLQLTTRAENAITNLEITTVGELVQYTESELLCVRNIGKLTLNHLKTVLTKLGLSFGVVIKNWPNKVELALLLEKEALERSNKTQTTLGTFNFVEDELCAIVKKAVDKREHIIVMRRTGWDGNRIWTLQELANDPKAAGRSSPISREWIRQIESKAFKKIQNIHLSTPLLDRTIALIKEQAPLAIRTLPSLLQTHGISRRGLEYKALNAAIKTFKVNWNLIYRTIRHDAFLLPLDHADEIQRNWTIMVKTADDQDVVDVSQVVNTERNTNSLSLKFALAGVNQIPSLDWLDRERGIYWSLDRVRQGWNKSINVCYKILTVVPNLPLKRLTSAVRRARTVRDPLPDDTLMNMLIALEEFDVDDGMVSRGERFRLVPLSGSDQLMINVAIDIGTVTTSKELREALVRQRLSKNYAHKLMASSPFWITTARGEFRFVGNQAQLNEFRLK